PPPPPPARAPPPPRGRSGVSSARGRPGGAASGGVVGPPTPRAYENDCLVERALGAAEAGACALHLRAPDDTGLAHALEHADRIRTATGLPVMLACTDGWALETPAGRAEGRHALLHTALVAGRIDAVSGWPLAGPGR
ncbi:hypothetical protein ACFWW0_33970, partial [Streptomyces violascens]